MINAPFKIAQGPVVQLRNAICFALPNPSVRRGIEIQ